MIDPTTLGRALDAASGRAARRVDAADLDLARHLLAVRRHVLAAPRCPTRLRHRLYGLPGRARPRRGVGPLARLVHDSWTALAPAQRGASTRRTLRYGADGHWLDVQILARPGGARTVHLLTLPNDTPHRVVLETTPSGPLLEVRLDDLGAGRVDVGSGTTGLVARVYAGPREILHTPNIDID